MKRMQAYKFQLRPKAKQANLMLGFAGCCRFVWNKALALEKETYQAEGKRLGFYNLCKALRDWKFVHELKHAAAAICYALEEMTCSDKEYHKKHHFHKPYPEEYGSKAK